jgi:tRNA pseudouridine13 synthase
MDNLNRISLRQVSTPCRIKTVPEDFIVEEILESGQVLEKDASFSLPDSGRDFTHFVLQKEGWGMNEASLKIADRLGVSVKRISYAGTKDKDAISTQLMSVFKVEKEKVLALDIGGMKILGAWGAGDKVSMGALLGNRFTIRAEPAPEQGEVDAIYKETNGSFPNYFGSQRFGSIRANTHIVGEHIIRGDLRSAVEEYLFSTENETNMEAVAARKKLKEEQDYSAALHYFPRHLFGERKVIAGLAEYPKDYANSLRRLPRQVLLMFVHAFQSMLFNRMLSARIKGGKIEETAGDIFCGEKNGFPDISMDGKNWQVGNVIGYESQTTEFEDKMLFEMGMRKEDFKVSRIPELNSKGARRVLLCPMPGFSYSKGVFRFSLPSGSYATSALREYINGIW